MAWFNNELKATWQLDPDSFQTVTGYAGDPISGAYTTGVAYRTRRVGGAGDEVNGIATGGSFSNVWRDNKTPDDVAIRWTGSSPIGDPTKAVWGGTPRKVSSNFFEWSQLNVYTADDPVRADILDKTLIWLIGHDHPAAAVTAPNGGETFTGSTVSITWTEAPAGGYTVASRKIYYSSNSGDTWVLITSSPGTSPYSWDITSIPNGGEYRVRILVTDNGTPALSASDDSNADFTINRAGGDTRGPIVTAGSIHANPNPAQSPGTVTLTATVTDVTTGDSNIAAAEWSSGATAAPAGSGTAMTGTFTSPTVAVSAAIDASTLAQPIETLWVRGRDAAGNWGSASSYQLRVGSAGSGVAGGFLPSVFALRANTPNPFRPRTEINFDLPHPSQVRLEVFDVSGRRVRTLAEGPMSAGSKSVRWDGRDAAGKDLGSGEIYILLFVHMTVSQERFSGLQEYATIWLVM